MPGGGRFHGRNEKYRFGRQTDVAFDQQGNIFVSDGYFDGRVVKYDKNGRFVKAVGTRGNAQPAVQHAALDRHRFPGQRLRRRSRQRARAGARQRPELEGELPQRRQPVGGVRVGRARTEEPRQAVSLRVELVAGQRAGRRREFTGEVYKMELDGTIVGKFGRAGKAAGRVRDDPPDGLPRSRRDLHRRDQQLALAEDPAEAAGR